MTTDEQILDQHMSGGPEGEKYVIVNMASSGKRLVNLIIDGACLYILQIFLMVPLVLLVTDESDPYLYLVVFYLLTFGVYIGFYWGFEHLTGKTPGKFITRTHIVKGDGSKPSSMNVLGRSACRMIPFEPFSFLGTLGKGWHDAIPKIYVINDAR